MIVFVREKEFTDKKKNEVIKYNEFYVTFEFCIDSKEVEKIDLPLKIEDKFGKQMLLDNIATADFDIKSNTGKNGKVYYNPVVTFKVGNKDCKLDVKMSAEAIVLARIGLSTNELGF